MVQTKNTDFPVCFFVIVHVVSAQQNENAWIYSVSLQKMCIFVICSSGI